MDKRIEKVIKNLEMNNMQAYFIEKKEEAAAKVAGLLRDGETVAVGGSVSLFECGVIDYLKMGKYNFLDRYKEGLGDNEIHEIHRKAFFADTYICSSNAITENGELYNVDGNANRVSAIAYGPKSVIIIAGINKIVKDLDEAVARVKKITAPAICKRRGRNTYCREKGICAAIGGESAGMTTGCNCAERTCCSYLVCGRQRIKGRIKVIIVGDNLGY